MSGTPANAIFLSYRRFDSNAATHNLHERLKAAFGEDAVFRDTHRIEGGASLWETIRTTIDGCRAFVVVIHRDWLDVKESDGIYAGRRRLENPADYVRRELQYAFAKPGLRIIPVLVDGTPMPSAGVVEELTGRDPELAETLSALKGLLGLPVRFDREFESDIGRLVQALAAVPGLVPAAAKPVFEVGGLAVLRPWALVPPRPVAGPGNAKVHASDLWILQAKYRVTELLAREADLKDLRVWFDAVQPIAARLLVGRAGSGKTRLGLEFVWQVFRERGDLWDVGMVTGETFLKERDWDAWAWRRPTLLLVDYVQAIQGPLRCLFQTLALRASQPGVRPLRILMLERVASATEGWFRDLLEWESSAAGVAVRELFLPPEPVSLQPLATMEWRRALLKDTLRAANDSDGRPSPVLPEPGTDPGFDTALEHDRWSDPLYLMMAALVAREGAAHGTGSSNSALRGSLHLGRVDLAKEIARHEIRCLDRFVPAEKGETGKRLFRHLAALATAVGGLSGEEAREVVVEETTALGWVWADGPRDLADRLHDALPAEDGSVAPIQPDIVAEALVLQVWTERIGITEQEALILRCARRRVRAVALMLVQGFQDFFRNEKDTESLLRWLDAIVRAGIDAEPGYLLAIEGVLPERSVALRELALRVTEALYQGLRGRADSGTDTEGTRVELARLAHVLAIRLGNLGRRTEAVGSAEEAVRLYRELVDRNPDAFTHDLANSLNNLAIRSSELGRRTEALGPAEEAVKIYRELAERNPDAFTPGLANSLNTLGNSLSDLGRRTEALGPAEEALKLRRELVDQNPDAFTPDLARSLSNFAIRLSALGRWTEAVGPAEEAVKLFRELADRNLDAFTPDLARSLNILANRLSELGRRTEAVGPAEEAVKLFRELAERNPDAFAPDLASSLNILANRLSELGRRTEAVGPAEEAVKLRRELVDRNSEGFTPALASSLNNLAVRLSELGRRMEALGPAEEAVKLRRELAERNPDAFTPGLGESLHNLANRLSELGRRMEALGSAEEAVKLRRELAERNPDAFTPALGESLHNLAVFLSELGRNTEALSPAEEAVKLNRELADRNPDRFTPALASSLNNLANRLSELGRRTEALGPAEEVVKLYRELAERKPDEFRLAMANSLINFTLRLSELGRRSEALTLAEEAVQLYRELAERDSDALTPYLANSLNHLATFLSELGRKTEALGPAEEAVRLYRELAEGNPDVFTLALAISLNNFAIRLSELGRRTEALSPSKEAVKLYRELVERYSDAFTPGLANAVSNLAIQLSELGRKTEALGPAEEAVRLYRELADRNPDGFTPDLARSLGMMGKVYEANGNAEGAMDSISEGVRLLIRQFRDLPEAFVPLITLLVSDYVRIATGLGREPDVELLGPVQQILNRMPSEKRL